MVNMVNTVNNITIAPWGTPLQLTDADVEAALSSIPGVIDTPALPEIVTALMELVKRSHAPPAARNITINPKRADQALALTNNGWAALPLTEATAALFDSATARIASPLVRLAGAAAQPPRAALRVMVPAQYRAERAGAVQLGLRPMEAHLANMRPGGPGPLLLEHVVVAQPAAAQPAAAVPQADKMERIKAALVEHPLVCSQSGALLMGWIVAMTQTAHVSGKELFEALSSGDPELAAAWVAAQIFTEEKMRPRAPPPY
ncbi:MAG: hypothetical protein EBU46_17860 [Nitrosomonadaceae bacterium]|nr:hypothetical protein [Nitrosomonadaceae bacterium]